MKKGELIPVLIGIIFMLSPTNFPKKSDESLSTLLPHSISTPKERSHAQVFPNYDNGDNVRGRVEGWILPKTVTDALDKRPFANETVTIVKDFSPDNKDHHTDQQGYFDIDDSGDAVRFTLRGPFVKVENDVDGVDEVVKEYLFAPEVNHEWGPPLVHLDYPHPDPNSHFNEVNVFYHINDVHDWFKVNLGFDRMDNTPISAVVYHSGFVCNACYGRNVLSTDPLEKKLWFSTPSSTRAKKPDYYAKVSDVIYHEYTHAVIDHIPNYDLPNENETGAMNEGFADYFATTINDDPVIGEGLVTQSCLRNLTHIVRYDRTIVRKARSGACPEDTFYWILDQGVEPDEGNDYGWVHHNSMALSGALWDMRSYIGVTIADQLIFRSINNRKPTSFLSILGGVIREADLESHEDGNLSNGTSRTLAIENAFARHGIYEMDDGFEENDTSETAAEIMIGRYEGLRCYDDDWYRILLNTGQSIQFSIGFQNKYGNLDIKLFDPELREIGSSTTNEDEERGSIAANESGPYYITIYGNNGDANTYTLDIRNASACSFSVGEDAAGTEVAAFRDAYNRVDGQSVLGCPTGPVRTDGFTSFNGTVGHFQGFENGVIEYHTNGQKAGQAFAVVNPLFDKWAFFGFNQDNPLGYPTGDLSGESSSCYGTHFKFQNFEGGSLEYHLSEPRAGSVFEVHGAIYNKWRDKDFAICPLGLPVSDERDAQPSPQGTTGRVSDFEGGHIHWRTDALEAFETHGAIDELYGSMGGTASCLGFPTSDEYIDASGYSQNDFEGGYITTLDNINYQAFCEGGGDCQMQENGANDSITLANPIVPPMTVCGVLNPLGDIDFFGFHAQAGQRVIIDVDAETLAPPSSADTVVTLYNSNGDRLAENDDDGITLDSYIEYPISTTGRYYFRVHDVNGNGGARYTYEIRISLE